MADAHRSDEWDRAASIIVKVHNMHITKSGDAIRVSDIHPYMQGQKDQPVAVHVSRELQMKALKSIGGIR